MVGVSCDPSTVCVAVGSTFPGPASVLGSTGGPVIEMRSDSGWTDVPVAVPAGLFGALYSVSCPSATDCEAVGWEQVSAITPGTNNYYLSMHSLVAHFDGTGWTVSMLANPSDNVAEGLSSVSCAAPGQCMATGTFHNNATGSTQAMVAALSDGVWTMTPLPMSAQTFGSATAMLLMPDSLSGISCPSVNRCVAVQPTLTGTGTVSETYNGVGWRIAWVPRTTKEPLVTLNSIQCFGASRCYAVGANAVNSIAEVMDGPKWHQINFAARAGGSYARLHSISCASFSFCEAVGEYSASSNVSVSFAVNMAAGRWSTSSLPVQSAPYQSVAWEDNEMWGVSCWSASACVAAGYASSFDVSIGAAQNLS